MPRLTLAEVHTETGINSGIWTGFRAEITGFYGSYDRVDLDDHVVREYNRKIHTLDLPDSLFIGPFDAGRRYIGDGNTF